MLFRSTTAAPLGLTIYPEKGDARVQLDGFPQLIPEWGKPLAYTAPQGKFSAILRYVAPQRTTVSIRVTLFIKDKNRHDNPFIGVLKLSPALKKASESQTGQIAPSPLTPNAPQALTIAFPARADSPCGGKLTVTAPMVGDTGPRFDLKGRAHVEAQFSDSRMVGLVKTQDVDYSVTGGMLHAEIVFARHPTETAALTLLLRLTKDGTAIVFQKADSISPPPSGSNPCVQPEEEFKVTEFGIVSRWEVGSLHRLASASRDDSTLSMTYFLKPAQRKRCF